MASLNQPKSCMKCDGETSPSDALKCSSCMCFYHDHCLSVIPNPYDLALLRLIKNTSNFGWVCPTCRNSISAFAAATASATATLVAAATTAASTAVAAATVATAAAKEASAFAADFRQHYLSNDETRAILDRLDELQSLIQQNPATVNSAEPFSREYSRESNRGNAETLRIGIPEGSLRIGIPEGSLRIEIPEGRLPAPPTRHDQVPPGTVSPSTIINRFIAASFEQSERDRSLIVYGLKPQRAFPDFRLFSNLLYNHLGIDVMGSISKTTRLGRATPGNPQVLRVTFLDSHIVEDILAVVGRLRKSAIPEVRSTYIKSQMIVE